MNLKNLFRERFEKAKIFLIKWEYFILLSVIAILVGGILVKETFKGSFDPFTLFVFIAVVLAAFIEFKNSKRKV